MRDQGLSKQIADLARELDGLGDQLAAQHDEQPTLSLLADPGRVDAAMQDVITQLTEMVARFQRNVAGDATGPVTSLAPATPDPGGAHGVHFSRSHDHAVAAIVDMVDDALAQDRAAVVVATGLHRRWIEADLNQRCIPFEGDACRLIDADATLSSLLVDGEPDRNLFRSIIGDLLADVCARNPGGVSVYGEMVGILWSRGQAVAAMRVEEYWNELQRELPFSLLCGYLIDDSPDSSDLDPVRRAHTHVA